MKEAGMVDAEEKRETGGSLMFAGLAVWVTGLLVVFFLPAAVRIGYQGNFAKILAVLGVLGAALMAGGWWMRRSRLSVAIGSRKNDKLVRALGVTRENAAMIGTRRV
jgi:uncharacterized membrane protein YqjE